MSNRLPNNVEKLRNEVLNRRAPARDGGAKKSQDAKAKATATKRFQQMNAFVDNSARLVGSTAGMVWLVIFREVKAPEGLATVSHRQIADCLGINRRTVLRALKELEEAGLLTVVKRGHMSQKKSSVYRLHGKPKHPRLNPVV